jgi:hypothetical protein
MKRVFDEHITQHQQLDVWVKGASEAADSWHRVRQHLSSPGWLVNILTVAIM